MNIGFFLTPISEIEYKTIYATEKIMELNILDKGNCSIFWRK